MNLIIKNSGLAIFIVAAAIALAVFMITITIIPINLVPNVVFAQASQTQPLPDDLQKFLDQKALSVVSGSGSVSVVYQSNQTIVLYGEVLSPCYLA